MCGWSFFIACCYNLFFAAFIDQWLSNARFAQICILCALLFFQIVIKRA